MADPVVLVVEDDPALGAALRDALAGQPVRLDIVHDAAAAIELLSSSQYCGMVLDLVLNGRSGLDVLRHVERSNVHLPTVIVAPAQLPSSAREMLDEQVVKLIVREPVQPRLLATVVLGLCGIAT